MNKVMVEQYNDLLEDIGTAGHSVDKKFAENDACPKQLEIGILVEYEHTDIESQAKKIALDHLSDTKDYYTKLIKAGLVDEKKALDKHREYYG